MSVTVRGGSYGSVTVQGSGRRASVTIQGGYDAFVDLEFDPNEVKSLSFELARLLSNYAPHGTPIDFTNIKHH